MAIILSSSLPCEREGGREGGRERERGEREGEKERREKRGRERDKGGKERAMYMYMHITLI